MVSTLREMFLLFIPESSKKQAATIRSMFPISHTIFKFGKATSRPLYAQMWSAKTFGAFDTVLGKLHFGTNTLPQD